jgi:hypothetical protein
MSSTDRLEAERSTRAWDEYQEQRRAETVRGASGMGFWRLVWIVALGIVLANVISGASVSLFTWFAGWLTGQ